MITNTFDWAVPTCRHTVERVLNVLSSYHGGRSHFPNGTIAFPAPPTPLQCRLATLPWRGGVVFSLFQSALPPLPRWSMECGRNSTEQLPRPGCKRPTASLSAPQKSSATLQRGQKSLLRRPHREQLKLLMDSHFPQLPATWMWPFWTFQRPRCSH